jgi:putative protease
MPAPMRKPELLAPAGGWEQLEYAIRFGADAVYLAADKFGMRQRACNFLLEDIPRAVDYAHERGAAVHITCNIQMHEADLTDLPAYLQAIDAAGADAVLVSDLGALRLARENAPHMAIHVSTQASVSNAQSALVWHELGASRIVCAREMSLESIASMRRALPAEVELEAFVHGAMCMAISGRCLISDYLTGRSAVSGHCTQPCRWSYALQEEKRPGEFFPVEEDARGSYIMNAKDLNMLAHLDDLRAAGIDSVKIEGRNKKAFYVATVVNAYRQVLDGADPAEFAAELQTVSHRPYSTGFYYGPAHQTPESDAYIRAYDWVAEVLACEPAGDGFCAEVLCRNRFEEGAELEVLSPRRPIRSFCAAHLRFLPEGGGRPEPVAAANRAMDLYRIDVPFPLEERDILRTRRNQMDASLDKQ